VRWFERRSLPPLAEGDLDDTWDYVADRFDVQPVQIVRVVRGARGWQGLLPEE
jgi:plasmid stabilization system protein ParE